jgi:hypothetical protein
MVRGMEWRRKERRKGGVREKDLWERTEGRGLW